MDPINYTLFSSQDLKLEQSKENLDKDMNLLYRAFNILLFGFKQDLYKNLEDMQINLVESKYHDSIGQFCLNLLRSAYTFGYKKNLYTHLNEQFPHLKLKAKSIELLEDETSKIVETLVEPSYKRFMNNNATIRSLQISDGRAFITPLLNNLKCITIADFENTYTSSVSHVSYQRRSNFELLFNYIIANKIVGRTINVESKKIKITNELNSFYLNAVTSTCIKITPKFKPLFINTARYSFMYQMLTKIDSNTKYLKLHKEFIKAIGCNPNINSDTYKELYARCDYCSNVAFECFEKGSKTIAESLDLSYFIDKEGPTRKLVKKNASSLLSKAIDEEENFIAEQKMLLKIFAIYVRSNPDLKQFDDQKFEQERPKILEAISLAESQAKEIQAKNAEKDLLDSISRETHTPKSTPTQRNAIATPPKEAQNQSQSTANKKKSKPIKVVNDIVLRKSDLEILNESLNSSTEKCDHFLHSRLWRWDTKDLAVIRQFKDKDSSGAPIQHYATLTNAELLKQQAFHYLVGIERILSNKDLADKFSFKYNVGTNDSAKTDRIGRCFYAKMTYKGKDTFGLVNVGIGKGNVIFHAMFSPLKEKEALTARKFVSEADKVVGMEEANEGEWKQVSRCTFEVSEKALVMNVQRQNVQFTFYPLKAGV